MSNFPDHPDIASALRTGYPSWKLEAPYCQECGEKLTGRVYYDEHHDYLCRECLLYFHERD